MIIDKDIEVLLLMVLLPLLPAFLLFKFLPSAATAAGPLKGLDVNMRGAIAGYLVILMVELFAFRTLLPGAFTRWDVKGRVAFSDGGGVPGLASFRLVPGTDIRSDGTFYLTVYAPNRSQLPDLQILEDGYETETKELRNAQPESGGGLFKLGTITLLRDKLPTAQPTQKVALVPLQ